MDAKLRAKVCEFIDNPKNSGLARKIIQFAILEPDLFTAQLDVQKVATFLEDVLTDTPTKFREAMKQIR